MSLINTKILPFETMAYKATESDFVKVTDQDLLGHWSIVLFYPADFTFVCPTELEDMAEQYEELKAMGAEVYAVSMDSHFVHKGWHNESEKIGKVNYFMLGDPVGTITSNFQVMREGQGQADRGTFIIDPEGIIQAAEITAEGIGRKAADTVRKLKAAQYVASHPGEVCPAKWEEASSETLKPGIDLVGKI